MDYAEIIIDNKYSLDLSGKLTSIPTTYELIDITDLNRRSGSKTKTISIPRTKKNDKIFGIPFNVNANNQFDKYQSRPIRIEKNSFVVFQGLCKLTDITNDTINLYAFAELSKLKELFGTRTLNDLNLSDLDHLYDETIFDTWDGIYPIYTPQDYFYPLIDYGGFQLRDPSISSCEAPNFDVFITDMRPAVYLKRIINQICIDAGYTLQTNFFDNPVNAKMLIPFTNNEFIHAVIGGIEINGVWANNDLPYNLASGTDGSFVIPANTDVADPVAQWDIVNYEFTAGFNQTTRWTYNFSVEFPNIGFRFPAEEISFFVVQKDTGAGYVEIDRYPIEGPNQRTFFREQYTNTDTFAIGDRMKFIFEKNYEGVDLDIQCQMVQFDPSAGGKIIEVGEYVQLAPNLPAIKQSDLFKSCYQMFNWVVLVNDVTGVVNIETFENFYLNGGQKDFSNKLSLTPNPTISYQSTDFNRKYNFQYEHDTNDYWLKRYDTRQTYATQYAFGDGNYYLTDEGETTLIGKVGFSPTIIEKSFLGGASNYWVYLPTMLNDSSPNVFSTQRQPRILINAGLIDVANLSNQYTELHIESASCTREQVPLCYFQKIRYNVDAIDSFELNLSFSTPLGLGFTTGNLISNFYANIIDSLSVSAKVVAYFKLTARDIAELNFAELWYIEYFGAIFRLNKIIDYQPNELGLTKVELINVGVKADVGDVFGTIEPQQDYTYLNTEILQDIISENNNDIII
jgi:hypothetical protein